MPIGPVAGPPARLAAQSMMMSVCPRGCYTSRMQRFDRYAGYVYAPGGGGRGLA